MVEMSFVSNPERLEMLCFVRVQKIFTSQSESVQEKCVLQRKNTVDVLMGKAATFTTLD